MATGIGERSRRIDRGVRFLRRLQNGDGGFELTPGRGSDTQSTAWSIQALKAADRKPGRAAFRYLRRMQRPERQLPLQPPVRDDAGLGDVAGTRRARARAVSAEVTSRRGRDRGHPHRRERDRLRRRREHERVLARPAAGRARRRGAAPRGRARRHRRRSRPSSAPSASSHPTSSSPAVSAVRPTTSRARRSPPRSRCRAEEIDWLSEELRGRFSRRGLGDYAARWACLPAGAEPLANPLGGAPGFVLGNVFVLPGLPSEMEAMFEAIAARFAGAPIASWRRRYRTGEGQIVAILEEATARHPAVTVGSYPRFLETGPEVEVVLKSTRSRAPHGGGRVRRDARSSGVTPSLTRARARARRPRRRAARRRDGSTRAARRGTGRRAGR